MNALDRVPKHPAHYDRRANSARNATCFDKPSKTQQQFKKDADINTLVGRFGLTGVMPQARQAPEYGDFSTVVDFQTAMQEMRRSQESFMALPARIRERFGNDPGRLLEFVNDSDNVDEARKLGILPPKPVEKRPESAPPASPASPAPSAPTEAPDAS